MADATPCHSLGCRRCHTEVTVTWSWAGSPAVTGSPRPPHQARSPRPRGRAPRGERWSWLWAVCAPLTLYQGPLLCCRDAERGLHSRHAEGHGVSSPLTCLTRFVKKERDLEHTRAVRESPATTPVVHRTWLGTGPTALGCQFRRTDGAKRDELPGHSAVWGQTPVSLRPGPGRGAVIRSRVA